MQLRFLFNSPTKSGSQQAAEPDKSYFSPPPAVSLPKGGGAIRGMGEKFTANPVTGTGSMSVPIATSPGRSGFGPQLSISYDSGTGDGIFGFGWSLSLPSITRKTDKGLPRYWDSEESDVFILSGAEDLVPVLDAEGKIVDTEHNGYHIRQYRPRIEGLFSRIERWTKIASGEIHWRSLSKDNMTTLYGKTAESRISDPKDSNRIFSWLICESYDDKGNVIYYSYKSENSENVVTSSANERHRTAISRSANLYLKHIQYGNLAPYLPEEDLSQRKDWLFEVVFDYGEHDQNNPQPNDAKPWKVRCDPFSSYRSGFEVRTYRLCQRVLMFHHFPNESEVGKNCLVRSLDLSYSHADQQDISNIDQPIYSFLLGATQTGYKRKSAEDYFKKSLPSLTFTYSEPNIDETVREVEPESLKNLPNGLDGNRYQLIDLDGEGLSGILTEQGDGWFYKRNLSPINAVSKVSKRLEPQFAAIELISSKPISGLANGAQFLDLAGDGQPDVVTFRGAVPGFYERTQDEGWESFVAFKSLPILDWDNPNLKFIDLNGDGHSDILITEGDYLIWYPSLAEDGFGEAVQVSLPLDEKQGPRVIFADSTQSIHLADMSGDGLTDIVRITNTGICYWPNLGYGEFGAQIIMDNAPCFDYCDIFNQQRIQLADIDGSGTTDILYLSSEGVQVYFNQSGNSWSEMRILKQFPQTDNSASVIVTDLLGNGTTCLVWSSPLPSYTRHSMRYINLMGEQKPHLLVKVTNNMGAETVIDYVSSIKFYLQDKLAGTPWVTKLPFPVHVVERVETYDRVSGNRFVTRYAYHHGYFDGVEREFRGFGRVDQWDTEEIGTVPPVETSSVATNLDAASFVPPVLTKTWFHTGAYFGRDRISQYFEHEYYREPNQSEQAFQASLLPDTILPDGLTADEEREAARSLKGRILRQEIYAQDGSDKEPYPYSVSERNYQIRVEQRLFNNRHAVFFAHDRETIDYHYERSFILDPTDLETDPKKQRKIFAPRVTHAMTLEVDKFGNGLKSVAIAYPRRNPAYPEQQKTYITYTENRVTNVFDQADWYRIGVPIETRTYELTGYSKNFDHFKPSDFVKPDSTQPDKQILLFDREINYEDRPTTGKERRLIEQVRSLYRPNNQANTTNPTCLALGKVESLALPCESLKLAFTPGLINQVYGNKINSGDLDTLLGGEGKYVKQDGNWWISSGRQSFDPSHFYLPIQTKDPFGNIYTTRYDDPYYLLVIETIDPLDNSVQIRNNYCTLQPKQITDPNGNRSQAVFDALGMVVGTVVMGKTTETLGDSFDRFNADLSAEEIKAFFEVDNPRSLAIQHLGTATTRIIYDLERIPVCAAAIARETHVSDLGGGPTKIQLSFVYSDGFGREAQTKIQAEPGSLDPTVTNSLILDPRWVGTGAKVYNNKGKPVRQYEPFFSRTHHFGIEKWGVSSTLFYDPVERVVATLHPNHSWEKVVFGPWQQTTFDVNDTVLDAEGKTDPKLDQDMKGFFSRLPQSDYLPTWYERRINGGVVTEEQSAATKTVSHANTPTIAHLDTLGRTFLTIADNGTAGKYETRVELDIEGNQRSVTDAKGRKVMIYHYDLLGHRLYQASMEAGTRWMLNNVAGKPIRMWDSRSHVLRTTYDVLQRPIELFVKAGNDPEFLAEKTVYGENQGDFKNHRGKIYQHFDSAGLATNEEFDFKGNLLHSSRKLVKDYRTLPDWNHDPGLETEVFQSRSWFDALNRPIQLVAPHSDQSQAKINVIRPGYNEANLLERMDIWLEATPEPQTLLDTNSANFRPVTNIDYDAKGQRTRIEYGNGAKTEYFYDKDTFRLVHLKTTRGGALFQDLSYFYDPVGNITRIRDDAQQHIFFNNQVVLPHCDYTYDPIYRLIKAEGREHIGQIEKPSETTWNDEFRVNLSHPSDGQAMRNYTEQYVYDAVGNFERLIHQAANGSWNRVYTYNETSLLESGQVSNRLSATQVGQRTDSYRYDAHGNMVSMPHLSLMQWDYKDQLMATARQVLNETPPPAMVPETTFYVYDASGERVRKVTEWQNGKRKCERIYLGGFELYREFKANGDEVKLERETLHVMDDKQRIALVETKTIDNPDDESPRQLIRFQFGNHLGSASLELDDQARVISYEEYYPYGSTSYQAVDKSIKAAAKRYRYTGKERDEETGLAYHGARYYAPWLGRWTSCDHKIPMSENNLYLYVRCNPINLFDPDGFDPKSDPFNLFGNLPKQGDSNPDKLPFNPQTGQLDPRYFPPPATYNREDLNKIRSTSPDRVLGRFLYSTVTGILGQGVASAPTSTADVIRDSHNPDKVGYGEQALNIALFMLPVEKILGWAFKGARSLISLEAKGAATTAEKAFLTELDEGFKAAGQASEKSVAANLARGNFGERLATDALASEGHRIVSYKPSIAGTNQPGIDIVTIKDGIVYFVDNKALTRSGNVSSVSALTTNFAKNKDTVLRELRTLLGTNISREERQVLGQAVASIENGNFKRVVTNANLASDQKLLTGVTKKLKSQGLEFKDVFATQGKPN